MRDPGRIEQVLAAVRSIWAENPDLRLGQLIVNAVRPSDPCPEVFAVEDAELVRKLAVLEERLRSGRPRPVPPPRSRAPRRPGRIP
jgi:hypothetical protein